MENSQKIKIIRNTNFFTMTKKFFKRLKIMIL